MVAKLHEKLAAEKTVSNASSKLMTETEAKLGKTHFFAGHDKTLSLIVDSPSKAAVENAARDVKPLITTVPETLEYCLKAWARTEDLLYQKNLSNTRALANVEVNGEVLLENIPVDELLGLEARLEKVRNLIIAAPTLDGTKKWIRDADRDHVWKLETPEVTIKQDKKIDSVVLYEATEKFPAQIKEISVDVILGSFSNNIYSGLITSRAKADALSRIDTLIMEVKKSRTRANNIDASEDRIGDTLVDYILAPIVARAENNS